MIRALIPAIVLAAALPAHAYAQFNKAMATNVANARFGWTVPAFEIFTGMVEKAHCASVPTNSWPDAPAEGAGMFDHRTVGLAYKTFIADTLLPLYVNHTTTNTSGVYFDSNATDLVMWDAASACVQAGISTNYLDVHGWFKWYGTNSWQHVADILNLCRWTKASTYPIERAANRPAVYAATNTTFPADQMLWIDLTAWENDGAPPNNWTNCVTAIASNDFYYTGGGAPFFPVVTQSTDLIAAGPNDAFDDGASFYNASVWWATNFAASPNLTYEVRSNRRTSWTWLDGLTTNYSHHASLVGRIRRAWTNSAAAVAGDWIITGTPLANGPGGSACSNVFFKVEPVGSEGEFVRFLQVNAGSVVATNYRAMSQPYLDTKLYGRTSAQNPATAYSLACSDFSANCVLTNGSGPGMIAGLRIPWEESYFLMRWDANASTGMQYIFD